MFKVPIKLVKSSIPLAHEHIGLWNQNEIELGKPYGIGKIGYGGSYARWNETSRLFEGAATFLEPNDYKQYKFSELSLIGFEWLFELLNIKSLLPSEIEYALYPHNYSGGVVPEWSSERRQQAVQCCQRS